MKTMRLKYRTSFVNSVGTHGGDVFTLSVALNEGRTRFLVISFWGRDYPQYGRAYIPLFSRMDIKAIKNLITNILPNKGRGYEWYGKTDHRFSREVIKLKLMEMGGL